MKDVRCGALVTALASRGFVDVPRPAGLGEAVDSDDDRWFHGSIETARGPVNIYLFVPDLDMSPPPEVWLHEKPVWIKGWRPHLLLAGSSGFANLCYNDFERYQLLAHDVGRAVMRVLEDAKETLDRLGDGKSVLADSERDFPRLWTSKFQNVYIDCIPTEGVLLCETRLHTDSQNRLTIFVSDNPERLAVRLGRPMSEIRPGAPALIFASPQERLRLTEAGPPDTLQGVYQWLSAVAPKLLKAWTQQMLRPKNYQQVVGYHFFVSAGQVVGYLVSPAKAHRKVKSAREARELYTQTVHRRPLTIHRVHADRADDEYLVRRNLAPTQIDLRGRRILLIGAGAIGGFLAQALVELGAGRPDLRNQEGALTVADRDYFSTANVGRHLLGLRHLDQPKAIAVCEHLKSLHPSTTLIPRVGAFDPVCDRISDFDLIIDATGYETYARKLAKAYRRLPPRTGRVLLHTWIEGRGGTVRAITQTSPKDACYDCLWNYSPTTEPRQRHPAYSDHAWTAQGDDGYATMTPFAVSAPLAAASLAIETLLETYKQGRGYLASRAVDLPGVNPSFTKRIARAPSCPSCST